MEINAIVAEMRDPKRGISVSNRNYFLRTYKSCFVATEAVDWIMARLDINTQYIICLVYSSQRFAESKVSLRGVKQRNSCKQ